VGVMLMSYAVQRARRTRPVETVALIGLVSALIYWLVFQSPELHTTGSGISTTLAHALTLNGPDEQTL
jgi:Na+-driven multidrug efflux pump